MATKPKTKPVRDKKPVKVSDLNKINIATPNVTSKDVKDKRIPLDFYIQPQSTWNVTSVASALNGHERGQFNLSGRLADAVQRDSRVKSVLSTRVLGVAGLPFRWDWPVDYTPNQQDLAALEVLKAYWGQIVPQATLTSILRNVVLMGFNVCNVYWELMGDMYIPKLLPFHPSNIQFNISDWRFMAYTLAQGTATVDPEDPNWMVFTQLDDRQPWMQGAIRSISFPWVQKNYALGDWRGLSAVHGQPIRKLKMPVESGTPPEGDPQQFIQDIALSARVGAPVLLPNGADLELMEVKNGSSDIFKDGIDNANTDIAIGILGQNLAVEVKGASLAATRAHLQILQEYLEADCMMLSQVFHTQLLQDFYSINFGPEVVVPIPVWDSCPPEDMEYVNKALKEHATALNQLSSAVETLKATGIPLDLEALGKMFKIPGPKS